MSRVHLKTNQKISNKTNTTSSGGKASQLIMNSSLMQQKSKNQQSIFGNNIAINNDPKLEREADIMGAKALQRKTTDKPLVQKKSKGVIQRTQITSEEFKNYVITGVTIDGRNKQVIKAIDEENFELDSLFETAKNHVSSKKRLIEEEYELREERNSLADEKQSLKESRDIFVAKKNHILKSKKNSIKDKLAIDDIIETIIQGISEKNKRISKKDKEILQKIIRRFHKDAFFKKQIEILPSSTIIPAINDVKNARDKKGLHSRNKDKKPYYDLIVIDLEGDILILDNLKDTFIRAENKESIENLNEALNLDDRYDRYIRSINNNEIPYNQLPKVKNVKGRVASAIFSKEMKLFKEIVMGTLAIGFGITVVTVSAGIALLQGISKILAGAVDIFRSFLDFYYKRKASKTGTAEKQKNGFRKFLDLFSAILNTISGFNTSNTQKLIISIITGLTNGISFLHGLKISENTWFGKAINKSEKVFKVLITIFKMVKGGTAIKTDKLEFKGFIEENKGKKKVSPDLKSVNGGVGAIGAAYGYIQGEHTRVKKKKKIEKRNKRERVNSWKSNRNSAINF